MGMLVLARRIGEELVIDPGGLDIRVMVTEAHGGVVRLGVDAPRTTAVHRKEVWERIKRNGGKGS